MFSPRHHLSRIACRWASLLALLRVVALVVGVQLSGLTPVIDELACLAAEAFEHDEPCPSDEPCSDCSPGCPTCHCSNGLRAVTAEPYFAPAPAFPPPVLVALNEALQTPAVPDLASLFRPPRNASSA